MTLHHSKFHNSFHFIYSCSDEILFTDDDEEEEEASKPSRSGSGGGGGDTGGGDTKVKSDMASRYEELIKRRGERKSEKGNVSVLPCLHLSTF